MIQWLFYDDFYQGKNIAQEWDKRIRKKCAFIILYLDFTMSPS